MLKKKIRLTKRGSFSYVYRKGKGTSARGIKMLFVPSNAVKIGFAVSNRIGKAVVRNLVKRRLRAILRENLHLIKVKGQIVFVAKEGIETMEYREIESEVKRLIGRIMHTA